MRSVKQPAKREGAFRATKRTTAWGMGSATWAAVAAVAVYLWAYGPALDGPFLFDDLGLPFANPAQAVKPLFQWIAGVRPLLMFSYWLNYRISSTNVASYHAFNLLFHLISSTLVFFIVRKLANCRDLHAGFAAAVFLLHPIQTEAVSYIAGRSDSLSVMFFLGAYALFLYRRTAAISWSESAGVLILFAAAVLSKEHTAVLPALLLLTDYYWNPGFKLSGIRANWRLYAPMALAALAGGLYVSRILAASISAGAGARGVTWYQYLFTQFRMWVVYLRLFLLPVDQSADYDVAISRTPLEHGAILGLLAILLLAAAAAFYARRRRLASFGVFTFLLLLAPTSSVVPIQDPLAERRLYLPMLGLLFVVVEGLDVWRPRKKLAFAGMGGVLLALTTATYARNQVWSETTRFWSDVVAKSPGKIRAYAHFATSYMAAGRCDEAAQRLENAPGAIASDYQALVAWGKAYECAHKPEQALQKLRLAAALQPDTEAFELIGLLEGELGRMDESLTALNRAVELGHRSSSAWTSRALWFEAAARFPEAIADYEQALRIHPDSAVARQGLERCRARLAR